MSHAGEPSSALTSGGRGVRRRRGPPHRPYWAQSVAAVGSGAVLALVAGYRVGRARSVGCFGFGRWHIGEPALGRERREGAVGESVGRLGGPAVEHVARGEPAGRTLVRRFPGLGRGLGFAAGATI